jgi:hypothetical protein
MLVDVQHEVAMIISEELIDNFPALKRLLMVCSPHAVNSLGVCGETPAHIAIYKNRKDIVQLLLQAGAEPAQINHLGHSLLHTAVNLGLIEILQLLYNTGKCHLEALNKEGKSLLHISQTTFEDKDLITATLFSNWSSNDTQQEGDIASMITSGRRQCEKFLKEKILIDRASTISRQKLSIIEHMSTRALQRRWMSDSSRKVEITYTSGQDFPIREGMQVMNEAEKARFKQSTETVNAVVTRMFSHEHVMNSIFMNR